MTDRVSSDGTGIVSDGIVPLLELREGPRPTFVVDLGPLPIEHGVVVPLLDERRRRIGSAAVRPDGTADLTLAAAAGTVVGELIAEHAASFTAVGGAAVGALGSAYTIAIERDASCISPDCRAGKHRACSGTAFDERADEVVPCGCGCGCVR